MQQVPTREELTRRLINKAMKDDGFRGNLIARPHETIGMELGVTIPDTIMIRVMEETPDTFYLVLPFPATEMEQELTGRDLENISAAGLDSEFWSAVYTRLNCVY